MRISKTCVINALLASQSLFEITYIYFIYLKQGNQMMLFKGTIAEAGFQGLSFPK